MYAIFLNRPTNRCVLPHLRVEPHTTVRLIGRGEAQPIVPWQQNGAGLQLDFTKRQDVLAAAPAQGAADGRCPYDYAYTLRINPRPRWTKESAE